MGQKIIYQHCLLFGISTILTLSACEEQVDYRVRADWVYINETNEPITLASQQTTIDPMDSLILSQDSEGPEEVTETSYVPPFSDDTVRYGEDECIAYNPTGNSPGTGEGPFGTANYESRKLEERYYEFIYRFTEEEFTEAEDCQ